MKVYVVEFRDSEDCDLAHIASSKEKAHQWCKDHLDYGYEDQHWWWAIYEDHVDEDMWSCKELHYLYKDGKLAKEQPLTKDN